jgi:hypothetical protein
MALISPFRSWPPIDRPGIQSLKISEHTTSDTMSWPIDGFLWFRSRETVLEYPVPIKSFRIPGTTGTGCSDSTGSLRRFFSRSRHVRNGSMPFSDFLVANWQEHRDIVKGYLRESLTNSARIQLALIIQFGSGAHLEALRNHCRKGDPVPVGNIGNKVTSGIYIESLGE